jgi:DNA-binding GntR family transcriptional regulator
MAYHFPTSDFEAPTYTIEEHRAYLAAVAKAQVRAVHSYFCQHILREDDGSYTVIDEGSYEPLIDWVDDRIVCTIPASFSDEF